MKVFKIYFQMKYQYILKTIRRSQQINILDDMNVSIAKKSTNPHEVGDIGVLFL